ncbi:endonuclease/exonuclease/phosphatase family protein [Streptococcus caviae]|uniref:endonuclease/exonuclease/phosphatase family protein n=1 Tax=Streptococcus sp. 'caviae' TaxID=1915004 RepID=UPI000963FC1F|nr:endonuclease/exonuclease/phosphatase family protein [Streptococcus sp. 'caviae']OLN84863.1 hydrolase [Streptococcus sp. 'caviae']
MEENPREKLKILAQAILKEQYDIICLQEVNQLVTSQPSQALFNYCQAPGTPAIHEDNYALELVKLLSAQGQSYYWSWAYNHIGYGRFQEGVAILSKEPLRSETLLVSQTDDERDYHTRRVLLARTAFEGKTVAVASVHLSWWNKGFEEEWEKLATALSALECPLLLMGDFNNPTDGPGYNLILKSRLQLKDSHKAAKDAYGSATIQKEIDGWQGNQEALKVDHIFLSPQWRTEKSAVVLDGEQYPSISDHCGLACEAYLDEAVEEQ